MLIAYVLLMMFEAVSTLEFVMRPKPHSKERGTTRVAMITLIKVPSVALINFRSADSSIKKQIRPSATVQR
jgi:hypothetical protein